MCTQQTHYWVAGTFTVSNFACTSLKHIIIHKLLSIEEEHAYELCDLVEQHLVCAHFTPLPLGGLGQLCCNTPRVAGRSRLLDSV